MLLPVNVPHSHTLCECWGWGCSGLLQPSPDLTCMPLWSRAALCSGEVTRRCPRGWGDSVSSREPSVCLWQLQGTPPHHWVSAHHQAAWLGPWVGGRGQSGPGVRVLFVAWLEPRPVGMPGLWCRGRQRPQRGRSSALPATPAPCGEHWPWSPASPGAPGTRGGHLGCPGVGPPVPSC